MFSKISSAKTCSILKQSAAGNKLSVVNYSDSYCLQPVARELSALQSYKRMVEKTPAWINGLLSMRNRLVRLVGLKDVGNLGRLSQTKNYTYQVGDQLDFFTIDDLTDKEMILTLTDHHLDITLSVLRTTNETVECLYVTTWVKYNNRLGRVYMFSIMPFHKMIIRRLLKNVMKSLHETS
jgi:hypothetical protein